ncbi:MAG: hypothetical protein A07HR60_01317 [uncultured archaeon A07HR60]|nr:MAG: hypothetical protein A07HR60_01317 [uncultured archaeon A07HR60]
MTLRHPHDCARCGGRIRPGEEFAAVDVLDPDGEIQELLCPGCARELREFLGTQDEGGYADGDDSGNGNANADGDQYGDGASGSGETRDDNSV